MQTKGETGRMRMIVTLSRPSQLIDFYSSPDLSVMSGPWRQSIRPSASELKDLPPEFDIEEEDVEDDDSGEEPTYAPAATPSRGVPPAIGTTDVTQKQAIGTKNAQVRRITREASSTSGLHQFSAAAQSSRTHATHSAQTDAKLERFPLNLDAEPGSTVARPGSHKPLIGSIQERSAASNDTVQGRREHLAGKSRFSTQMHLDRDAGIVRAAQRPQSLSQSSTRHRSAESDEEWMDEFGQAMSAFRKSRLIKQGARPPSTRKKEGPAVEQSKQQSSRAMTSERAEASEERSMSSAPESMQSLLAAISSENEAKVAAMSPEEVESNIDELRDVFSDTLLAALKGRRAAANLLKSEPSFEQNGGGSEETEPSAKTSELQHDAMNQPMKPSSHHGTAADIRRRYFPDEGEEIPSSLQWTQDQAENGSKKGDSVRLDFDGRRILPNASNDGASQLAGLHHHGDDQGVPGYTVEELLHLARSTLPSQRVIALQTLTRAIQHDSEGIYSESARSIKSVRKSLQEHRAREKSLLIASWYILDPQATTRQASLACIYTCVSKSVSIWLVDMPLSPSASGSQGSKTDDSGAEAIDTIGIHKEIIASLYALIKRPGSALAEISTSFNIFLVMAANSRLLCGILGQYQEAHERVTKRLLRSHSSDLAATAVLTKSVRLTSILVASGRGLANDLAHSSIVSSLPRILSIAPWKLPEEGQDIFYGLYEAVLDLYAQLGRYGLAADSYGANRPLFLDLQQWLSSSGFQKAPEEACSAALSVTKAALDLFAIWAICATDPHQTAGHHDITKSQIIELPELAATMLNFLSSASASEPEFISSAGAAAGFLTHSLNCFRGSSATRIEEVERQIDIVALENLARAVCDNLHTSLQAIQAAKGSIQDAIPLVMFTIIPLITAAHKLSLLGASTSSSDLRDAIKTSAHNAAAVLMRTLPWTLLGSDEARRLGSVGLLRQIVEFVQVALSSHYPQEGQEQIWLELACNLPMGCEEIVQRILLSRLSTQLDTILVDDISVLKPFLLELTRKSDVTKIAPLIPESASLRVVDTLFLTSEPDLANGKEASEPIEADLWQSLASGLPLRRDWPLAALDDLLHSGSCAALHRQGALPPDWDATEEQIVKSALRLTGWICKISLQCPDGIPSSAPSSSELHLGIMKILMLEEEQTNDVRSTGKITGRDIFRKEDTALLVAQIFTYAEKLRIARLISETVADEEEDLEAVTRKQNGEALPFYQFYTSLLGLYDDISFGFELFGRAIVIPLQSRYASDYKKLFWNDYAQVLRTISTRNEDAPGGLEAYLQQPETHPDVIHGMQMALLGGEISKTKTPLLFAIATGHMALLIWYHDGSQDNVLRSKRVAQFLFKDPEDSSQVRVPDHIHELRQAVMASPPTRRAEGSDANSRQMDQAQHEADLQRLLHE